MQKDNAVILRLRINYRKMKHKQNRSSLSKGRGTAKQLLERSAEIEKKRFEQGFLGRLWGSSPNIPSNIAALLIVSLTSTGILYTFCVIGLPADKIPVSIKDFWTIIFPVITLALGYLFRNGVRQ